MLPGSGVAPPSNENDSEGTGPSSLSQAYEGQFGEWQPTPEFWSHQTAWSPRVVVAFCSFNQYVPLGKVGPLSFPISVQMLYPYKLVLHPEAKKAIVWSK